MISIQTHLSVDTKAPLAHENAVFGQYRLLARSEAVLCMAFVLGVAPFFVGCSKHEAANQTTVAAADTNQDQASAASPPPYTPPASAPETVNTSPNGGADLRQLNHIYIGWIVQNRRRPKNFDDFVTSSGVQIPPAPAGKKYVIDKHGFIALADE